MCVRGWGALTLESGMGMCCPQQDPFSDHFLLFQRPTISSPSSVPETPLTFSKEKNKNKNIFKLNFHWLIVNFSTKDTFFFSFLAKICSQDPSFKLKKLFCRSYFWKPVQHIPTKMIWTISPRVSPSPSPPHSWINTYISQAHSVSSLLYSPWVPPHHWCVSPPFSPSP